MLVRMERGDLGHGRACRWLMRVALQLFGANMAHDGSTSSCVKWGLYKPDQLMSRSTGIRAIFHDDIEFLVSR